MKMVHGYNGIQMVKEMQIKYVIRFQEAGRDFGLRTAFKGEGIVKTKFLEVVGF